VPKTYLELASETVTAMVNRGLIRIETPKTMDWRQRNNLTIHTIGWAVLEMYRELQEVPQKARQPRKKEDHKPRIITTK
jgi:hypothetical protein